MGRKGEGEHQRMRPSIINQSERLITLKNEMSERELHILSIELDRQRKSTGVTYGLCFLGSWLGLHKFYLGKIEMGMIYIIAPLILIFSLLFSAPRSSLSLFFSALATLAGCVLFVWVLVDLFTIPKQVRIFNENLEMEVIASLEAKRVATY